jgi:hypothetical protein
MCGADPEGLAFPWREQPKVGPVVRVVVNFDLPSTKQPKQPASQARILPVNQSPSESFAQKQDPVSAVHSAGGHGGGGGRLASHPFLSARPMAIVNFNLPSAEQPKKPVSPEQILPANRSPSEILVPKQDPVSTVHFAGGLRGGGRRLAGCPVPPARSTAAMAAPDMDLPPNFSSSQAEKTQGDRVVEVADVHAWAANHRAKGKRKAAPPDEVAGPPLPPKQNFGIHLGPIGDRKTQPKGKPTSLMQPQPLAKVHPFTPTLKMWRHGIEVDCGPDWSWDVIEAAVEHGLHPTARTPKAAALFEEDIEYQRKAGFCTVIPLEEIKQLCTPNLKISPMAAVPQVGRRPRIILNLSIPVYQEVDGVVTVTQASVNDTTALQAPSAAVKEIGKVLPRLLTYMQDTPVGLHILMSKLDISNGFWRLILQGNDCYNFAYVLPQREGEPCQIVVPSAVQMGWVESPALFCAVTELARDLVQNLIDTDAQLPPHKIMELMDIDAVPLQGCAEAPTKLLQVYVDDFCYAATQSKDGTHIPTIRRAAIHGIEVVFPPPVVTKHKDGKDPISWKKLLQGDGHFQSKKDMIGFIFDWVKCTEHLPPAKVKAYIKEIHHILRQKSIPLKTLQGVVGKIRHASIILPAVHGFFTPINAAMRGSPKSVGLGANSVV